MVVDSMVKSAAMALAIVAAAALSACASDPPSDGELRPAPAERVFQGAPVTSATPARVAFVRDAGGSHPRNWRVSVDGHKVASLWKAEYAIIDIDPGPRQISVELDVDGASRDLKTWIDIVLTPGSSQVIRLGNTSESKFQVYRDPMAKFPGSK